MDVFGVNKCSIEWPCTSWVSAGRIQRAVVRWLALTGCRHPFDLRERRRENGDAINRSVCFWRNIRTDIKFTRIRVRFRVRPTLVFFVVLRIRSPYKLARIPSKSGSDHVSLRIHFRWTDLDSIKVRFVRNWIKVGSGIMFPWWATVSKGFRDLKSRIPSVQKA